MSAKRKNKSYKGKLNLIVDQTFHPYFKNDKSFVIIDGAFHFLIEQNPKMSIKKFLKYSLKHLL